MRAWPFVAALLIAMVSGHLPAASAAPNQREQQQQINIRELPLPPTAPSTDPGSCTRQINPHATGCISASEYGVLEGPAYMPDGHAILLTVVFSGAPAAPAAAGIYSGMQVIAIKTDGTRFPAGDAWKCLTCGVPDANSAGINRYTPKRATYPELSDPQPVFDHPQPFLDGKRVLAGTNILDCGPYRVTDAACTPARLHIYPLRWETSADGSGAGGGMRELRLNPDGVHIGWSSHVPPPRFDEFGFFGRLVFDPSPRTGTPRSPRYEIRNVSIMLNTAPQYAVFMADPDHPGYLLHNRPRGVIGEFRGFSSDGRSALGLYFEESGNIDLYSTDLQTGQSRRLTSDPSYTDPSKLSPDDRWLVYLNPRQSDRHMYYAGLRGIPPVVDTLALPVATCCYNNGNRRFFQPYLLGAGNAADGNPGRQLNAGPGLPGSASDPNWNARADPAWSPDGRHIVYWQALVTAPSCGGTNPLPCPPSTEPGGRHTRLMIATLVGAGPVIAKPVTPVPDTIPWGIPYHPGDIWPVRAAVKPGKFVLKGAVSGEADVEIVGSGDLIASASARYRDFSDDGHHVINGAERVERSAVAGQFIWHSDLRASGAQQGEKLTSEPGGFIFDGKGGVSGTLTTTIKGHRYAPPEKGS